MEDVTEEKHPEGQITVTLSRKLLKSQRAEVATVDPQGEPGMSLKKKQILGR